MGGDDNIERIALVEEWAEIAVREVERGRVRISTTVDTRAETAEAALHQEDVVVERVAVDRPVDAMPALREEDGVLIVPVVEERLVVIKQLVLKEELHIRTHTRVESVRQPVLLRSERAEVTRIETPSTPEAIIEEPTHG